MTFNTTTRWGWPAKTLHRIGALAILLLLGHGWWMTHMASRPERLAHYAGHSAMGYDLLALTVLRLLWRWLNPVPALPADLKPWERAAARAAHFLLYLLTFVVSVTGWIVATTSRTPMTKDLFGISWPALVTQVALDPAVDRGVAHGAGLCAGGGRGHPHLGRAAPPYIQAQ
jgi:cytochrome b561